MKLLTNYLFEVYLSLIYCWLLIKASGFCASCAIIIFYVKTWWSLILYVETHNKNNTEYSIICNYLCVRNKNNYSVKYIEKVNLYKIIRRPIF